MRAISHYVADVSVPDAKRSSGARIVMTTGYAPDLEIAFAKGVEGATYYAADSCVDYAHATVQILACCAGCQGSGQKPRMRRGKPVPYSYHRCPDCEGAGSWPIDRAVTLVRRLFA